MAEKTDVRRDYIARKRKGESVQRKTDFGLAQAFEALKGKHGGYISDHTYLNGWVRGSQNGLAKITLLWTDGTGKRGEDHYEYEHYFWLRTEDVQGRTLTLLRRWKDGGTHDGRHFKVRRWEVDDVHPKWTKVYVDCPSSYFYTRSYLTDSSREDGRSFVVNRCVIDGKERRIQSNPPSYYVAAELERRGTDTFEADLNPIRRFVADVPVRYPDADGFSECYFDIETDDRPNDVFTRLGAYRILSICWVDKHAVSGELVLEDDTDEAERKMLRKFLKHLESVDVLASWNGYMFDYFYVFKRCQNLGLRWKWWRNVFCDLLPVFKRYHFRAGSKNTSFKLGAIGESVLGEDGSKLDLTDIMDKRYPNWRKDKGGSIGTWASWCLDKDLLTQYNIKDCDILRRIEEFTGYGHLDFTFSQIGNCFANDYHISTKVDGLMVRKGLVDGVHFPTIVKGKHGDPDQFEGGYVHDPIRGIHHEVCAFDFKSLYPSMMTTFNISPDTYVAPEQRHKYDPSELITTPIGTTFSKPKRVVDEDGNETYEGIGFIPQMFAETLDRRKTYTDLQNTVEVGSDMFLHYYRLAYSYKRLGLSFYGELGNVKGRYYAPQVGRSTTLSGQYFIKRTMDFANTLGFRSLYGDTDSMYVQMDREHGEPFVRMSQAVYFSWFGAEEFMCPMTKDILKISDWKQSQLQAEGLDWYVNKDWNVIPERSTVYLEFEDVYGIVCLINKKRYFGKLVYHKGKEADHLEIKGLEVMRSDGLLLGRQLQERIMRAIAFEEADGQACWDIIAEVRGKVMNNEYNPAEMACISGLTKDPSEYKSTPPHVRVAMKLARQGKEFYVGMKVPYIWVRGTYVERPENDPSLSFQENVRAQVEWKRQEAKAASRRSVPPKPQPVHIDEFKNSGLQYDAEFYWDRKVYPPTLRILEVSFPDIDWGGLSTEISGKRGRKIARYRKALLDPNRRTKTLEAVGSDALLRQVEKDDLRDFYLRSIGSLFRGDSSSVSQQ